MKKTTTIILSAFLLCSTLVKAQENPGIEPYSFSHEVAGTVPTLTMPYRDFAKDIKAAEEFEKNGNYPRIAFHFDVNKTMLNSGVWTDLTNGDRIWRLNLKSDGAIGTALFFNDFFIPQGAMMHVYSPDHKFKSGSFTFLDNQGDGLFSTEFMTGSECTIEYFEPAIVRGQGKMQITSFAHQYRSMALAQDCEVNIICSPEGNNWQAVKKGVVRVYVVEAAGAGYCSGSLINNTNLDCTRYILTAFHCGVSSTTANFTQFKFYFNFEASTCGGGDGGILTNFLTGCTKTASSNDNGGDTGSDFLLLHMTATSSPSWWSGVYYNGWNRSGTAPASGSICIHHPNGDNKKISATTGTGSSVSWGGQVAATHWSVHWGGTTNGWGVTEGGSSGSPLFNSSKQIIGTLTGGGSYCNSVQAGGQNQPDAYGKLSHQWISNGTTSVTQLKPWLDPANTGVTSLPGTFAPCTQTGIADFANENDVILYPNPTNGSFTVSVTLTKFSDIKFRVMNVMGQEVSNRMVVNSIGGNFEMDLSGQAEGIYFVEIKANGNSTVKKVTVVH